MRAKNLSLVLSVLCLLASGIAHAQFGYSGPGPKMTVIMQPDVQKELKLTKDQKKQIQSAMSSMSAGSMGANPPMSMPDANSINAQMDAPILPILKSDQLPRLNELWIQYNGPRVLIDPTIADQLKLTDDEKTKIKALWDQYGQEALDGVAHARSNKAINAVKKKRKDADAATLALLTPDQVAAFTAMEGKQFKFQMPNEF